MVEQIQKIVEECIDVMFSDYSVHPSGVIIARQKGHRVEIVPKRVPTGEEMQLWGWSYAFIDPKGNTRVIADSVYHADRMIHKIQTWRWAL